MERMKKDECRMRKQSCRFRNAGILPVGSSGFQPLVSRTVPGCAPFQFIARFILDLPVNLMIYKNPPEEDL